MRRLLQFTPYTRSECNSACEELYLADILEAADDIGRFLLEADRHSFIANDLLRSAVLHKLTVIGEGAARLPDVFRARHPQIEWGDIVAFRNIIVHAYFSVDWPIVWVTATQDVPALRREIACILAQEYPDGEAR